MGDNVGNGTGDSIGDNVGNGMGDDVGNNMETGVGNEWKWTLSEEPYWLWEAVLCMNWSDVLDGGEWLEEGSGWSRAEREAFLAPYRRYRDAMRERLEPVFMRCPKLWGYVDRSPRKRESFSSAGEPVLVEFLTEMQDMVESQMPLEGETWERRLNKAFERMLNAAEHKPAEAPESEIHGLSDVLRVLESWDGSDADKFQYIRLYSEAGEVIALLRGAQNECRKAGCLCLPLVKERLESCMESLRPADRLSEFLLKRVGIKQWEGVTRCQVYPAILHFDGVRFQGRETGLGEEGPDFAEGEEVRTHVVKVFLGIDVLYLLKRRDSAPYDDTKLLAQLKAVGDPTRMKILHLLAERPYYLQELAKELGLTPATVSHHMGVLITEELIGLLVTNGKKRVYYQIQKEKLKEIGQQVERLSLSREEQIEGTAWRKR